jgi:hypothetical protein
MAPAGPRREIYRDLQEPRPVPLATPKGRERQICNDLQAPARKPCSRAGEVYRNLQAERRANRADMVPLPGRMKIHFGSL